MAIKGLTDRRTASFPQIGVLRKGTEKQTNANGKQTYGKDLQGFRFDTDDPEALDAFTTHYGDEPRSIDVYLPFETVDENFETSKEAWSASALQHRCDGETCTRWLDKKTGKYSSEPIPCPGGCKEVGRLKVIIPALRRMVYVVAETHSIHDLVNLTEQLTALYIVRGSLRGIPMILSRRPREISTPRGEGQRARVTKWLMSIEAAPSWVELQLSAMERQALPGGSQPLALPEPVYNGALVDVATGELIDAQTDSAQPSQEQLRYINGALAFINAATAIGVELDDVPDLATLSTDKLADIGKQIRSAMEQHINALADESGHFRPTMTGMKPSELRTLGEKYIKAIAEKQTAEMNGASYEPIEGEVVA